MTEIKQHPAIYASLAAIAKIIAAEGVAKAKQTEQAGKFWYRGIDDVTSVMATPFAANNVLVVPSYEPPTMDVRQTNNGGNFYVASVMATFTLTSTIDGSEVKLGPIPAEAGDSGDKAVSKACSVALRNALLQTFLAPIGPEMDPENGAEQQQKAAKEPTKHAGKPKPPAKAPKGEAPGITGLSESQLNILARKRDMANLSEEQLLLMFPSINMSNINEVFAKLKNLAEA